MLSQMFRLVLVLALLVAPLASAGEAETSPFTRDLMRYLGLDPAKRLPELEKGTVVHNGVSDQEKLPDEVAAAGAMLLVRASPRTPSSPRSSTPRRSSRSTR
jgi:hypothetical protein